MMNGWYLLGILCGVLLVWVIGIVTKRFGKCTVLSQKNYDERQILARGKAFRDGFWTILGWEVLCALVLSADLWSIRADVTILLGCFLGLTVFLVSCIFRDAYLGLHEHRGKWMMTMAIIGGCNLLFSVYPGWGEHEIGWLNLFCGLALWVGLAAMGIKCWWDRHEGEEEA